MEIVEKVLVSFESHKDVARAYRVSTYVVNHLISKVQRNPLLLSELLDKKLLKESKRKAVSQVVEDLNQRNVIIDKSAQVKSLAEKVLNEEMLKNK